MSFAGVSDVQFSVSTVDVQRYVTAGQSIILAVSYAVAYHAASATFQKDPAKSVPNQCLLALGGGVQACTRLLFQLQRLLKSAAAAVTTAFVARAFQIHLKSSQLTGQLPPASLGGASESRTQSLHALALTRTFALVCSAQLAAGGGGREVRTRSRMRMDAWPPRWAMMAMARCWQPWAAHAASDVRVLLRRRSGPSAARPIMHAKQHTCRKP